MNEFPRNGFENPDPIPTPEEVKSIFEQLLRGQGYETQRMRADEEGLLLSWDILVRGEDGNTRYYYNRKGQDSKSPLVEGTIDMVFFDKSDSTITGYPVAKYVNGKWKLIS
jgi:hypothetical protein